MTGRAAAATAAAGRTGRNAKRCLERTHADTDKTGFGMLGGCGDDRGGRGGRGWGCKRIQQAGYFTREVA